MFGLASVLPFFPPFFGLTAPTCWIFTARTFGFPPPGRAQNIAARPVGGDEWQTRVNVEAIELKNVGGQAEPDPGPRGLLSLLSPIGQEPISISWIERKVSVLEG